MRQAGPEAAGGRKSLGVKLIVQRIDGYGFSGAGRVHESMLADVDADMVDLAAIDLEEDQVAAPQLARLDLFGLLGLIARSARHLQSEMPMRVEHEPAAVETIARRATVAITRALQRERELRERFAAVAHVRRATAAVPRL